MSKNTNRTRREEVEPYITRDESQIRELMHPAQHVVKHQSLAEATVAPGGRTRLHRHRKTEEVYHCTAGRGEMFLGDNWFEIGAGDSVAIAPGTPHALRNPGTEPLVVLCACAPAYSHNDTELLPEPDAVID